MTKLLRIKENYRLKKQNKSEHTTTSCDGPPSAFKLEEICEIPFNINYKMNKTASIMRGKLPPSELTFRDNQVEQLAQSFFLRIWKGR